LGCTYKHSGQPHEKAKAFTLSAPPMMICTTEEVLTEYLNYFAASGPQLRRKVAINVHNMMENQTVEIVPQPADSFRIRSVPYASR
jgi:hypothetical protein